MRVLLAVPMVLALGWMPSLSRQDPARPDSPGFSSPASETGSSARGSATTLAMHPRIGPSDHTVIIANPDDECTGELIYHHDDSFEGGECWQYGGIVPAYYGAFGEGFDAGSDTLILNCVTIWATQVGNYFGQPLDIYVWDGGVTSAPGAVLYVSPGRVLDNVPYWPSIGRNDLTVECAVAGEFTAGYWADYSASVCGWYIAEDTDGYGGYPWTCIAPGLGYPTGWQNPGLVWGAVQSLGFGVSLGPLLVHVAPDGTGDYPTIQAAVDAVPPGAHVILDSGVYVGTGNRDIDLHGKNVVIRSQSLTPESCVIDCEGSEAEPHRGFVMVSGEDDGTRIEALTIRNGWAPGMQSRGGAILCQNASPRIIRCILESNQAREGGALFSLGGEPALENCILRSNTAGESGGAVCCRSLSSASIVNSILEHNIAESGGGGAVAADWSSVHMSGCTMHANRAGTFVSGAGIDCTGSADVVLERCIIAFSVHGCAVACVTSSQAACACCDVYGNAGGDWIGGIAGQEGQQGNIHLNPLFCDRAQDDLRLWESSPCNQQMCGLIGALPVGCSNPQEIRQGGGSSAGALVDASILVGPNPFEDWTQIRYEVPGGHASTHVRLRVFDISGRCLRVVVDESQAVGDHVAAWNGRDERGDRVRAGIYFWRLDVGDQCVTRPLVRLGSRR
jgi:hypothetical protein